MLRFGLFACSLLISGVASVNDVCYAGGDGSEDHCGDESEQSMARKRMIHPPGNPPIAPQLPRLSAEDLDKPENLHYKLRYRPFILTGAMEGWEMMNRWPIDTTTTDRKYGRKSYLGKKFQRNVADFYPFNMISEGQSPYLTRFSAGIEELVVPSRNFGGGDDKARECKEKKGCRYLHLQLTPSMLEQLEEDGDLPADRHYHTKGDTWWMRRSLAPELQEEFHLKTHWKIILIGSEGSGMFNHSDSLMSSSWHGHVQGRKWWYICGHNRGPGPDIGKQACYESILHEGEIIFYGHGWSHETRILDDVTTTITGTVVTQGNYNILTEKLKWHCTTDQSGHFHFSGQLCDGLDVSFALWEKYLGSGDEVEEWRWRDHASKKAIEMRDGVNPAHNNYDGRNYITE